MGNTEKTRWFLVMRIKKHLNNELNRLLQVANDAVTAYGQLPLYTQPSSYPSVPAQGHKTRFRPPKHKFPLKKPPSITPTPIVDQSSNFHISIGWSLSPPSAEESKTTPSGKELDDPKAPEFQFQVKAVKLKIGNTVTSISLISKKETHAGIF